jgi:hypothetical protein
MQRKNLSSGVMVGMVGVSNERVVRRDYVRFQT